ncbi:MAG: type II toxin-antitoxin system RelE/ParE family toxin, partial [Acidobacteria bacterium]|nr:type II toxin-antitoxin system RelE/ParE family toxin [Acidobacteriota bacterium]
RLARELVDAFRMLARTPGAGHTRVDLAGARPPLFWSVREYLILYRPRGNRVEIDAILNGTRDVSTVLSRRGS